MRPEVEEMRVKRSRERVSRWGGRRNLRSAKGQSDYWQPSFICHLAGLDRNRARVRVTATNEMMQSIQEWSSLIDSSILIVELF